MVSPVQVQEDHELMNDEESPGKNNPHGPVEFSSAVDLRPRSLELVFWDAFALATSGCVPESLPLFRSVFSRDPNWIQILKGLLRSDRIEEKEALSTILAGTGVEDAVGSGRVAS